MEKAGAAVVLVDGKPAGMITRQDVLTFLSAGTGGRPRVGGSSGRGGRGASAAQDPPDRGITGPGTLLMPGHLLRQGDNAMRRQHADGFETLAIHAGQEPDPLTGAVVPPIYQVSTYKQDGVGGLRGGDLGAGGGNGPARWIEGYEYSRSANPTRGALEECLAALEGGNRALAFASGMAAEDAGLRTGLQPGDDVLIPHDSYGGTFRLFDKIFQRWGVSYRPVHVCDPAAVRQAMQDRPARLIWVETPSNPLLSIADITALAQI